MRLNNSKTNISSETNQLHVENINNQRFKKEILFLYLADRRKTLIAQDKKKPAL
jgi:hypothetical protein